MPTRGLQTHIHIYAEGQKFIKQLWHGVHVRDLVITLATRKGTIMPLVGLDRLVGRQNTKTVIIYNNTI